MSRQGGKGMQPLTPMMQQYMQIKKEHEDYILFYRLGDFYEMFFDDAKLASRELDLVLTGRDCGQEERAPMCGVPYHSAESYIARLIAKGYKVAICEQTEDPATAKGLVRREVIRMITPGTVTAASMLDERRNNYICSAYLGAAGGGVCFADISTGEVYATYLEKKGMLRELLNELGRFMPREAVLSDKAIGEKEITSFLRERLSCAVENGGEERFDYDTALETLRAQFGAEDLTSVGLDGREEAVRAVGGLMSYLKETQKTDLSYINNLSVYRQGQFMELDLTARRNLELTETMIQKEKRGSLLWVLDRTRTAMGGRLLRQWLEKPLIDVPQIKRRQNAAYELKTKPVERGELSEALHGIYDIERLIGRIVYGTANCRDLRSLAQTALRLPDLRRTVEGMKSAMLCEIHDSIDELSDLSSLITSAVVEDPPFSVREGGMILSGYSEELDRLRDIASGGRGMMAEIETKERERTGISKLKIGYNRVFGYYIEVSKASSANVPDTYIRKQTLANCERYITPELKELENTVLSANERIVALEYELFTGLLSKIAAEVDRVQRTAHAVAKLDVLYAYGETAEKYGYTLPEVDYSDRIDIRDGRHPVVEQVLKGTLFVPNDTTLDCGENRVAIITGPNMAGKSTYMRQVALIVIMAQIGSLVPAKSAHIGVCDRVFTRVGASDDLSTGKSTFMVEMSEVADILKFATPKSLLILDEIGRGTSTFDGMAIARAVLEFAAAKRTLGAKTLFATHYHELTIMEDQLEGVKNYNIAVKKRGDDITFLRKIIRGGADDSYGIEVAKLAGLPGRVIERAKEILKSLEEENGAPCVAAAVREASDQVSLLDMGGNEIAERLRTIDVNALTPIEAMNLLYELKLKAERMA